MPRLVLAITLTAHLHALAYAGPPDTAHLTITAIANVDGGLLVAGGYDCDEGGVLPFLVAIDKRGEHALVPPTRAWPRATLVASDVIVRANGDRVERSTDRGATWTSIETRDPITTLIDGGTMIGLVGDAPGGTVLRSTDRGATWEPVRAPTDQQLVVGAAAAGTIYVAGDRGALLASRDAGATWRAEAPATKSRTVALWASSATVAFAVAEDGGLSRTLDGQHWRRVAGVKAVTRVAGLGDHVIVHGDRPAISHDGGATWAPLDALAALDGEVVTAADVFYVVRWGRPLRSIDHGITWTPVALLRPHKCY